MSFRYNRPDPQQLEYDALLEEFGRAVEEGYIDQEYADELGREEPESHVYGPDDFDGYDDPEEAREVFMEVGSRDLADKIRFWRRVLSSIEECEEVEA